MNEFFKEAPTETRMFSCPACREIISVGTSSCRYCGIPIDEATAGRLNAEFKQVTDAVSSANTFKESIWLALLLTIAMPLYVLAVQQQDPRVLLASAAPIGFLAYAISWKRKYGRLETTDKDYPESVRAMRRSLIIWAIALLIQASLVLYEVSLNKLGG